MIGALLVSAVITYNIDSIYLSNKYNTSAYLPDTFYKNSESSILITTTDKDGNPVSGKDVRIELLKDNESFALFKGVSDESGSVQAVIKIPDINGTATLVIKSGEKSIESEIEIVNTYRIIISTDKPIYQPGQIIHIRTLTFEGITPKPCPKPVKIEIQDPESNLILRKTLEPNSYGVASLDFPLSDQLSMGNYKIKAFVENESSEVSVLVKRYVLPKFSISFDGLKSWYLINESISGSVNCRYFFGKDVEGTVLLKVLAYYGEWKEVESVQGSLRNGSFEFNLDGIDYAVGVPFNEWNGLVELRAEVTDEGGHVEEESHIISISEEPIRVSILADKNIKGAQSTYYTIARFPDGSPVVNATVSFSLSGEGSTDERGVAMFTFKYNGEKECRIKVVKDSFVTEKRIQMNSTEGIKVIADKMNYNIGDNAKFSVYYNGNSMTNWVYYEVVANEFVITTGRAKLSNGKGSFDFTVTQGMFPLAKVRVYKIEKDLELSRDTAVIGVHSENTLDIEIERDKEIYLPHEKMKLHFRVLNNSKPVFSVLGISIVDKSVFELGERFAGYQALYLSLEEDFLTPQYEIHGYLFSDIPVKLSDETPELVAKGEYGKDAKVENTWKAYNLDAKEIKKNAIDLYWTVLSCMGIAVYILTLAGSIILKKFRLMGALLFLGIIVSVIYVAFASTSYIGSGVQSTEEQEAGEIKGEEEDREFAPLLEEDGKSVNIADAGKSYGEGKKEIRARQYFPETWYWNPVIITDENGNATLTLTTPDSITTWKVEAIASTMNAEIGVDYDEIVTFQEFFIEPDIPASVVRCDEFPLRVLIYNYDENARDVTVELEEDDWFRLLTNSSLTVRVDGNSVSSALFRINATVVGEHQVLVHAYSDEKEDKVIKVMRVEPDGKALEMIENGELRNNQSVESVIELDDERIPFSENAYVKIQGGMESVLIDGAEGYINFVSGCGEQSMSTLSVDILAFQNLQKKGLTDEKMFEYETIVTQGIQHELMYLVEAKNGKGRGIVWFPGDEDVHPWLTSWGLITFQDARNAGFTIDDAIIKDMQSWLVSQQNEDGSYNFPEWGLYETTNPALKAKKVATTAYITRALLYSGYDSNSEAVKKSMLYIESKIEEQWNDPYTLAIALIALEDGNGDATLRGEMAGQLVSLGKEENGTIHWDSENSMYSNSEARYYRGYSSCTIETTGYAIIALNKHGSYANVVSKAVDYLLTHRSSLGGFFSTQDTVVAFQALNSYGEISMKEMTVNIYVSEMLVETINLNEENKDITYLVDLRHYLENVTRITIQSEGEGVVLYQIYFSQYLPWDAVEIEREEEIILNLTYNTTNIKVDDSIVAKVELTYNGSAEQARMILIDLRAPVGFSFIEGDFEILVSDRIIDQYEIRERQVIVYLESLEKGVKVEFYYHLVAKEPIKGVLQGIHAYDMYNTDIDTEVEPVEISSYE